MSSPLQTMNQRPMLTIKSFYFLYYAAMASLGPFLAIYYQQLGFSGRQIGLLAAIPPLLGLISMPLWGAAADITGQSRKLLFIAIAAALVVVFFFSKATLFAAIVPLVAIFYFAAAAALGGFLFFLHWPAEGYKSPCSSLCRHWWKT